MGRKGYANVSSASSSLTHRMASPPFQQHPGVVPSISLAKKCTLSVPRVRCFKNLEFTLQTQEKRMCLNNILDNEGVWSKRICGYSWKTYNGDHIHCTPVTCLPRFHLQHPAQGRDVLSTSHSTAQPTPASCIAQQSESQTHQHSEGKAGRGGICWSSPLPRWCITWRGEHVTPQSHAQVLPCTVSHLQTGFSLAPRGCSHFPSQVCKQTGLVPARASVTCPACSPPSLGS